VKVLGVLFVLFIVAVCIGVYLVPTWVGIHRRHNPAVNLPAVIVWNVFAGWFLLGWVLALVYALRNPKAIAYQQIPPAGYYGQVPPPPYYGQIPAPPPPPPPGF
jgi:hypothetical protein